MSDNVRDLLFLIDWTELLYLIVLLGEKRRYDERSLSELEKSLAWWIYKGDQERAAVTRGLMDNVRRRMASNADLHARLSKVSREQFATIAEALGDAYAYRNDTDDPEDYEVETMQRYAALAKALGVTLAA